MNTIKHLRLQLSFVCEPKIMHVHQSTFARLVLHDVFENLVVLFIGVVFATKLRNLFQFSVLCCGTMPRTNGKFPTKNIGIFRHVLYEFILLIVECFVEDS